MSETPAHYRGDGKTTCADAMASMMHDTCLSGMGAYWWGCTMKYVWRWPHKGGAEDIEKAIDCLQKLLVEEVGCNVSIQCTECVHCRVDGVSLVCDCFDSGVPCSMAHGTNTCGLYARKEVGPDFLCSECEFYVEGHGGFSPYCGGDRNNETCSFVRGKGPCMARAKRKRAVEKEEKSE